MASTHPLVERFRTGEVPAPLKSAAARGALPLPAEDLLEILFHLRRDPNKEIQQDIVKTIETMPLDVVQGVAASPDTPPTMLDFLTRASIRRDLVLEKVVMNPATADATLSLLAQHGSESILEFLSFNQVRLTRAPQILDQMLQSPRCTQSIRRRLLEIRELETKEKSQRGRVTTEAPAPAPPPAVAPAAEPAAPPTPAAPPAPGPPVAEPAPAEEIPAPEPTLEDLANLELNAKILEQMAQEDDVSEEELRLAQKLLTMTVPEKVQLAMKGDREARMVLIRDSSKQVQEAVIASPKLSDQEIEQIAKMRSISVDVIRAITSKREAMKIYSVVSALVRNPKCPTADAMTLMQRLMDRDLSQISKDKNIPDQVRRHALIILDKRKPKAPKKTGH